MLTLDLEAPIAGEATHPYDSGRTRADHPTRPVGVPMLCESLAADAVCHLLTGFFMIEKLSGEPHADRRASHSFERASENVCTVLESLDECSNAFWLSQKDESPEVLRVRDIPRAFKGRRRGREARPKSEIGAGRPVAQLGAPNAPARSVSGGSGASEDEKALSSALLQLVGAYRAMDALSSTPFRTSSPFAFELGCHCLCAAIVALEERVLEVEKALAMAGAEEVPNLLPHR